VNKTNGCHLNEEQILKAIIDKEELVPSEKDHLSVCQECRSALESFEKELKLLGQTAERFVPLPRKRTVLYEKTGKNFLFGWRTSFAAAIITIFLVITVNSDSIKHMFNKTDIADSELYSEDILMTEVSNLVENSLPAKFLFVSEDGDTDYDEDFIDFIVPSAEDEVLSGIKKGGYIS
jgi:hypothetical protein